MKKVYALLFEEVEEVEFVTVVDYLRRAGIEVVVAGVSSLAVKGRSGIELKADKLIAELRTPADCIFAPGGPGSRKAGAAKPVADAIRAHYQSGKLVAAICAAPVTVLGAAGVMKGKRYTCYPGMEEELQESRFSPDRVVLDGNLLTSRAAGTAGEFAVALIAQLAGKAVAEKIAGDVMLA